jgi:hypothetical protein
METTEAGPIALGGFQGEIKELRLPIGLILDSVRFESGPARFGFEPFSMELGKPGKFEARITAEALQAYLEEKAPGGARDFAVRFEEGRIVVGATARVIMDVRVGAVCGLGIEEGKRLVVNVLSAEVMGLSSAIAKNQIEAVNPVFDAGKLPLSVSLDSVRVEEPAIN